MAVEKFTAKQVENLSRPGLHSDGDRLYLQVKESGAKSWLFRYEREGKMRNMGLGPFPTVGLADAREKARAARKLLLEGVDPMQHRDGKLASQAAQAANARTFEAVSQELIGLKDERGLWKKRRKTQGKSKDQWESTLRMYVYPVFGSKNVSEVTSEDVERALSPIWSRINETARRLRGRIENVLDFAAAKKYRDKNLANAARWKGDLQYSIAGGGKQRTKKVVHHPALPRKQMHEFMTKLRARKELTARLLEWTILTCIRTTEARMTAPAELKLDEGMWEIPGGRMKMDEPHQVPLTPRMLELARVGLANGGAFLFTVQRGRGRGGEFSNCAMLQLLDRMGYGHVSVHGFRSTFKDWAIEETSFEDIVSEMALAHKIKDEVKAAYLRGSLFAKRAHLMLAWEKFCGKPYVAAKVLPLRKAA